MELDFNELQINVTQITSRTRILDKARLTVSKGATGKMPSSTFLTSMFLAEHSPIRELTFDITVYGVPSWVATHYVRHHVGSQPYVSTHRSDRCEYTGPRGEQKQGALVDLSMTVNAQGIIDISKKRLCRKASPETRYIWQQVVAKIDQLIPELGACCTPSCVYRGFCPETKSCGSIDTPGGQKWRREYLELSKMVREYNDR